LITQALVRTKVLPSI